MKAIDCPKWDGCSASACPLDCSGKHRKRENICFYAFEYVKPDSAERFHQHGLQSMHDQIKANLDWLILNTTISKEPSSDLTKRLRKASQTKTRMICQVSTWLHRLNVPIGSDAQHLSVLWTVSVNTWKMNQSAFMHRRWQSHRPTWGLKS